MGPTVSLLFKVLSREGSGAGGVQTAKASRKQSSLSGKESAQGCLSMGFPRQEYWNGLPFPSPRNLRGPGIEPVSPAFTGAFTGGFFTTKAPEGTSITVFLMCLSREALPGTAASQFFFLAKPGALFQSVVYELREWY